MGFAVLRLPHPRRHSAARGSASQKETDLAISSIPGTERRRNAFWFMAFHMLLHDISRVRPVQSPRSLTQVL